MRLLTWNLVQTVGKMKKASKLATFRKLDRLSFPQNYVPTKKVIIFMLKYTVPYIFKRCAWTYIKLVFGLFWCRTQSLSTRWLKQCSGWIIYVVQLYACLFDGLANKQGSVIAEWEENVRLLLIFSADLGASVDFLRPQTKRMLPILVEGKKKWRFFFPSNDRKHPRGQLMLLPKAKTRVFSPGANWAIFESILQLAIMSSNIISPHRRN